MVSQKRFVLGFSFFALLVIGVACQSEDKKTKAAFDKPFPRFEQLNEPLLLPKKSKIGFDTSGGYTADGKRRHFIGTVVHEGCAYVGMQPTPGYDQSLKWLYEDLLTYESGQRVGIDLGGCNVPNLWMKEYVEDFNSFFWPPQEVEAMKRYVKETPFPLYVDFTCASWAQGALASKRYSDRLPKETFNIMGFSGEANHWVPYSVTHPKGKELYLKMWKSGAQFIKEAGGKALFYELFNEPAYHDPSPHNRALFVQRLKKQYGSIEKLNQVWKTNYPNFKTIEQFKTRADNPGLFVDWAKFMEDVFVDICREGIQVIRSVDSDPDIGFCVQPLGYGYRVLPKTNINCYKLSKICNVTSASTGGGDYLHVRYLKSISRGKPIHDGETYIGRTKETCLNRLWEQYARGINASYLFKWAKRSWDPLWKDKTPEGGKKVGEKFPWLMLNPYATSTETLEGIMDFKQEMMVVEDFFTPRDRGISHDIALLMSYPTSRYSQATGDRVHNEILEYAKALEFSHHPYDVLLEEQMKEEQRHHEYKVIVAAGVSSIYPETKELMEAYVKKGGVLILGLETMRYDEYGDPIDWGEMLDISLGKEVSAQMLTLQLSEQMDGFSKSKIKAKAYTEIETGEKWKGLGAFVEEKEQNRVLVKQYGKGLIYYIGARMKTKDIASVLNGLLKQQKAYRNCVIRDYETGVEAFDIEVQKSKKDGVTAFYLCNRSLLPQLVKITSPELKESGVMLIDPLNELHYETQKEEAVLVLPPQMRKVIICGEKSLLSKRFSFSRQVSIAENVEEGKKLIAEVHEKRKAQGKEFSYSVDLSRTKSIDLRAYANRAFEDRIAGDGKGGWTDQGENSLIGMEWGEKQWLGVPFEIIRWDHNEERACIVLGSQKEPNLPTSVKGIPVNEEVDGLYFVHVSSWTGEKEVMKYVLNHSDGSQTVIPIRGKIEIGDWWWPGSKKKRPDLKAKVAWKNSKGRGLYAYHWKNPNPEKLIKSIDLISSNGNAIPIVVAITAELRGE